MKTETELPYVQIFLTTPEALVTKLTSPDIARCRLPPYFKMADYKPEVECFPGTE
jgi:hypothetical protein